MSLAHSIKTVATFLMSVSQLCARIMERIICFAVMSCKWSKQPNLACIPNCFHDSLHLVDSCITLAKYPRNQFVPSTWLMFGQFEETTTYPISKTIHSSDCISHFKQIKYAHIHFIYAEDWCLKMCNVWYDYSD